MCMLSRVRLDAAHARALVCVCVRACVCACVRACVRECEQPTHRSIRSYIQTRNLMVFDPGPGPKPPLQAIAHSPHQFWSIPPRRCAHAPTRTHRTKQDALKYIEIERFPPILFFNIQRYRYDMEVR